MACGPDRRGGPPEAIFQHFQKWGPKVDSKNGIAKWGPTAAITTSSYSSSALLGSSGPAAGPKPKPEPGAWSSSEAEAEAGGDRGAGCRATNALLRISANSAKERAGRNFAVMPWRRQSCDQCWKGPLLCSPRLSRGGFPKEACRCPHPAPHPPLRPPRPGPQSRSRGRPDRFDPLSSFRPLGPGSTGSGGAGSHPSRVAKNPPAPSGGDQAVRLRFSSFQFSIFPPISSRPAASNLTQMKRKPVIFHFC